MQRNFLSVDSASRRVWFLAKLVEFVSRRCFFCRRTAKVQIHFTRGRNLSTLYRQFLKIHEAGLLWEGEFLFFAETLDARFGGSNNLELYVYGTIGAISAAVFLFFFFRII